MYYIVEKTYIGPNQAENIDADTIVITSVRHSCIDGDCRSMGDWAEDGHGAYETIDEARAAVAEKFGSVRTMGEGYNPAEEGVLESVRSDEETRADLDVDDVFVEVYKPGTFEPLTPDATLALTWEAVRADVEADMTDERIDEYVAELADEVGGEIGCSLHRDTLVAYVRKHRDQLRAELEEEAEEECD